MLEYTKAGDGPRLAMLLLHDDPVREYAYGPARGLPASRVGTFTQALYDQAVRSGWVVISMKDDWDPHLRALSASSGPSRRHQCTCGPSRGMGRRS